MPIRPEDLANAPIIGAKPEIILFHAQALIKCACSSGPNIQLLLINGVQNFTKCPRCGRMTCIESLGNISCDLRVIDPTPADKLM